MNTAIQVTFPQTHTMHTRLLQTASNEAVVLEEALFDALKNQAGKTHSPRTTVTALLLAINGIARTTPQQSDYEIILLSRVPRYVHALFDDEESRTAVIERFHIVMNQGVIEGTH